MKNADLWKESKFEFNNGKFVPSSDVSKGSWLVAQLLADRFSEAIPTYAKGKLLDLGCGAVPLYGLYKQYITENICVDWDNSLHGNNFLDINMDISKKLPFEECCFQTIICSDVLEHIYSPKAVLDEIVRVCDHGGYIILTVPFSYWMHEKPYDYNRMTEFFYRRYAEENDNIELVELKGLGGRTAVLVDKYAKIGVSHRWMCSGAVQKMYYKHFLKKDNSETDTLEFFVVFKKN